MSLYSGLPSIQGSLFCSKNERRRPFFTPVTVPSSACRFTQTLQNTFDAKFRPIAPPHGCPMPNPYSGESGPLTGRKMGLRAISGIS